MTRTQIQLPDALILRARTYAAHEEISLAEVVRHALDAFLSSIAPSADFLAPKTAEWHLPSIHGGTPLRDPFEEEGWRYNLHLGDSDVAGFVAEDAAAYDCGAAKKGHRR